MASQPCLLTYQFSTDPAPIQASTEQATNTARINLFVASGDVQVYCNTIKIAVPIGKSSGDLSATTPTDSVNTAKWSMTSFDIVSGSDLGLTTSKNYARYTFETRDSTDNKIDYDLVLGLVAAVNQETGEFGYLVQELSGTDSDPSNFTEKQASFKLGKSTPQFYLNNFISATSAAPTVPATEFTNSTPIRMSWESNGTYFQIYEKGVSTPVYAGTKTYFTLQSGLKTDTTFVLVASVTAGGAGATAGYEPIFLMETLTSTVSNPDLTPQTSTISGNASVGGTLGVAGASTLNTVSASSMTSSGAMTAGSVTSSGALNVGGASTVTSLAASSNLNVSGTSSFNNTTINGALTANGTVAMHRPAALLATGTTIAQQNIVAKTDGFVTAYISWPSNVSKMSNAYAHIYSSGNWFLGLGGSTGTFGSSWVSTMVCNPCTMCIPVQAGTTFAITGQQLGGNQLNSTITFQWYPTGTAASAAETYEILDSSDVSIPNPPEVPVPDMAKIREAREERAREFLGAFEAALDTSIDAATRDRLAAMLSDV